MTVGVDAHIDPYSPREYYIPQEYIMAAAMCHPAPQGHSTAFAAICHRLTAAALFSRTNALNSVYAAEFNSGIK